MADSIEAVYENGVFRPLRPVHLVDGVRVRLTPSPPSGPLSEAEAEALLRQTEQCFEGLSQEETAEVEDIMLERCNRRGRDE